LVHCMGAQPQRLRRVSLLSRGPKLTVDPPAGQESRDDQQLEVGVSAGSASRISQSVQRAGRRASAVLSNILLGHQANDRTQQPQPESLYSHRQQPFVMPQPQVQDTTPLVSSSQSESHELVATAALEVRDDADDGLTRAAVYHQGAVSTEDHSIASCSTPAGPPAGVSH
jgi:hypothetical protein